MDTMEGFLGKTKLGYLLAYVLDWQPRKIRSDLRHNSTNYLFSIQTLQ